MTIDKVSWGYRADARLEDFLTIEELIKGEMTVYIYLNWPGKIKYWYDYNKPLPYKPLEITITVSTGGNILINVGPTHNGLIQPIFVERLRAMGTWLKVNGDAIYDSRPWIYQNDTKTPDVWYTSKPQTSERTVVYAIVLSYPYDSAGVNLYSLGGKFDNNSTTQLLGYPNHLKVSRKSHIQVNKHIFIESFFFSGTDQMNQFTSNFRRKESLISWAYIQHGPSL